MGKNKKDYTIQEKLTGKLWKQVAVDFERYSTDSWGAFKVRNLCPEYAKSSSYHNACRHRFNYLKKLKKSEPAKYFELYGKAVGGAYRDPNNSESEDDDFHDDEDDDPEENEEEPPATPGKASAFQSPSSAKRSSARRATPSAKKRGTPQEIRTDTSFASPFASPTRKMASSISSHSEAFSHDSTPSAASTQLYQGDLEKAMADANMKVYVTLDFPENNGAPLFSVQVLRLIDSPNGMEVTSQLKIHLHSLIDLRDFAITKATVICNGRAVLVTVPKIPFYRRDQEEVEKLQKLDTKACSNTKKAYITFINELKTDPSRALMKILFVMPFGMSVSANLDSGVIPVADQKLKLLLNKQKCEYTTGTGNKAKKRVQEQNSGFWVLRVVSEKAGVLREEAAEDEDDLDAAFSGCVIDNSSPVVVPKQNAKRDRTSSSSNAATAAKQSSPMQVDQSPVKNMEDVKAPAPAPSGFLSTLSAALARSKEKTTTPSGAKDLFTKQNEENRRLASPAVSRTVDSEEVKDNLFKAKQNASRNKRESLLKKIRSEPTPTVGRTEVLPTITTEEGEEEDEFGNMSESSSFGPYGSGSDSESESVKRNKEIEKERDAQFHDKLGYLEQELLQDATYEGPFQDPFDDEGL